jgi:hypothetical protein
MDMRLLKSIPAASADLSDPSTSECLIAPPVVTDESGRVLVMYQRLIESGFEIAQAQNGA